jgi:hypothetical protein
VLSAVALDKLSAVLVEELTTPLCHLQKLGLFGTLRLSGGHHVGVQA